MINKNKIGNFLLVIAFILLLCSCGAVKKKQQEKEIHYELVTTLRDSLVITHETQVKEIERTIERIEDKKEKADNYKRTDKDGTVHEYYNYNTEVKIDEKTKESIKELQEKINLMQVVESGLIERLDSSEKETDKIREQLDILKLTLQLFLAIFVIYIILRVYKKVKKV